MARLAHKLVTSQNRRFRNIVSECWPNTITPEEQQTDTTSLAIQSLRRLGSVCSMSPSALSETALMDSGPKETRSLEGNKEMDREKGDVTMQPDLGHHHRTGCRPTAVALSCGSLVKYEED